MRLVAAIAIGVMLAVAMPARAQDKAIEVSGGYQYRQISSPADGVPPTRWNGWYIDTSRDLGTMLALVGEVGGTYRTASFTLTAQGAESQSTVQADWYTYLGGMRVRLGRNGLVTPFAQGLVGGAHMLASTVVHSVTGSVPDATSEGSQNAWTMALDGGVDLRPWDAVGVRVLAGYLRTFNRFDDLNTLRLNVGIVLPF
jgi:hypothetical protein